MTADTLAADLKVSVRTIYRDIATLQSMGAPIRGEGGIGYQIEAGFFLPPLHFDADELDALLLGVRMVTARGDDALGQAAYRLLGKIETVLSEDRQHLQQPLLAVCGPNKSDAASGLSALRTSIRHRKKLAVSYEDVHENRSERVVRPLGLTAFETVWILTGWCELRQSFRNFRLDRLVSVSETGDVFKKEKGKEFADYLRSL
ncbi:helix-turn-helix transcriptional regulator [Paracoccus fistulariae]|nr:YafY family protein [Paracoccus fistulariae]